MMRTVGSILLLLAIVSRVPVMEGVFSPDGYIGAPATVFEILALRLALATTGVTLWITRSRVTAWWLRTHPARWIARRALPMNYTCRFVSLTLFVFITGGVATLLGSEGVSLFSLDDLKASPMVGLAMLAVMIVPMYASAKAIVTIQPRRFLFSTALFAAIATTTLYASELAASFFVAPWPARGLHGIFPDGPDLFGGRFGPVDGVHRVNTWGQRDREHTIEKPPGVRRIALVGDSFLEESERPLSLWVQQNLRQPDTEILNLGISATSPDEYYDRIKNIALPLRADHCILFFYAGNDFVGERALTSWFGIAATCPRDSLLSSLGLSALNHLLTSSERPVLRAWGRAGELNRIERERSRTIHAALSQPGRLADALCSIVAPKYRRLLRERLSQGRLDAFLSMLRQPDGGLFRSYPIVEAAMSLQSDRLPLSIDVKLPSYRWIQRAKTLCEDHDVRFTVVIIPMSYQVDPRVRRQWAPLAPMHEFTKFSQQGAGRLRERLQRDHIEYVDLQTILQDKPGTYLNLDGHWSERGLDLVSRTMTQVIQSPAPTPRPTAHTSQLARSGNPE